MNKVNFFYELASRFFSSKPDFFKKLQMVVLVIALLALGAIAAINWFGFFDLGTKGAEASTFLWGVITFIGGSLFGIQATTTKPELQDNKTKQGILKNATINDLSDAKSK